jgi:predicted transcriptional regulator of viral defense system
MAENLLRYAALQFGVVTADQAEICGYQAREIDRLCRKAEWSRPRNGIYLPGPAPGPNEDPRARYLVDIAASMLALNAEGVVASHITAAILWGFEWIVVPSFTEVQLARPAGPRSKVRHYPGLRVRPTVLPPSHVTKAPNGMPVTTPARTIVDLARTGEQCQVLVSGDDALKRQLTTRAEIAKVVSDCAGWPGIRHAARLLDHLDPRSESPAESLARGKFLGMGLEAPDLQVEIFDAKGNRLGRVDLYFRARRLVIEVDGQDKYKTPKAIWDEKRREDRIRELDVEFLRLSWGDLTGDQQALRERVDSALARADLRNRRRAS